MRILPLLAACAADPIDDDLGAGEGWRAWTFWQHSDRGRVAGIAGATDLNHFAGDRDTLAALIAASYLP